MTKTKITSIIILTFLLKCYSFTSYAQSWGGTTSTSAYAWRTGNTSIGSSAGAYTTLQVVNDDLNSHITVSGTGPAVRFNNGNVSGDNGDLSQDRGHLGLATSSAQFLSSSSSMDLILRTNTADGNILFGSSNSTTERMRIASNGSIGIGAFSSGSLPSQQLHIKGGSPIVFVDASSGNPGIQLGSSGSAVYDMIYNASSPAQLKLGPTSTSYKAIYMRASGSGTIVFSNNSAFATSGNSGLSGTYLFDSQLSATSMLVSATGSSGSYPTIPSGYIFSANGDGIFTGKVSVNNATIPSGYQLAVKGKVICEELKVKYSGNWPDTVFSSSYNLPSLTEVENYYKENKHLKDVPSEAEVNSNGILSAEMDATLLKKIEELTLYVVEMNKEVQTLKEKNKQLELQLQQK